MPSTEGKFIILRKVDSTNNYAMGLIQKGVAEHGTAVLAMEQTAGKGRYHRGWNSAAGENILLSVITDTQAAFIHDNFSLSMMAALSVCDLLEEAGGVQAFVKWPNDIFIHDRKAAGILIENVIRGSLWQWAVTGFGVNLNQVQFPNEPNATSLAHVTGKQWEVEVWATRLRRIFIDRVRQWISGQSPLDEYNARLYKRGQTVRLQAGSRVFEAEILGVTQQGKLVTKNVLEQEWTMDEIRMKLQHTE